jgi:hypothetical protein
MQINERFVKSSRTMNSKYIAVVATLAVMLIAATALSTTDSAFAGKKKEYSQATSQVNDCGNGSVPTNILCQNLDSQIQGDGNAATITGEQQSRPPNTGILIVFKFVECAVQGQQCPGLPDPEDFEMFVEIENGDLIFFDASATGTPVRIPPGLYGVSEIPPPNPPGLVFFGSENSEGCFGIPIEAGEIRTCIVTNLYFEG